MGKYIKGGVITAKQVDTLSHFFHNTVTNRLQADLSIETIPSSFFLGGHHNISSGAENVFFVNNSSSLIFFSLFQGLRPPSLTTAHGPSGLIMPLWRHYDNYVNDFNEDNMTTVDLTNSASWPSAFVSDVEVSILGAGFYTPQELQVGDELKIVYNRDLSGIDAYIQILDITTLTAVNSKVDWWFDHPFETQRDFEYTVTVTHTRDGVTTPFLGRSDNADAALMFLELPSREFENEFILFSKEGTVENHEAVLIAKWQDQSGSNISVSGDTITFVTDGIESPDLSSLLGKRVKITDGDGVVWDFGNTDTYVTSSGLSSIDVDSASTTFRNEVDIGDFSANGDFVTATYPTIDLPTINIRTDDPSFTRKSSNNYQYPDTLDEDNMVSDSATQLATQQSIKRYVDDANKSAIITDAAATVHDASTNYLADTTSGQVVINVFDDKIAPFLVRDYKKKFNTNSVLVNIYNADDVTIDHIATLNKRDTSVLFFKVGSTWYYSEEGSGESIALASAHTQDDDFPTTIEIGTAPASASAAGIVGEIVYTTTHIYVCTATNTWKRTAIATW